MALVYIGLGSNLGDRAANLSSAKDELLLAGNIEIKKSSSIEETVPVGFVEQPDFLNQIILVKTEIDPKKFLEILKRIEKKLGRVKTFAKGPRIIDLDILLYDNIVLDLPFLKIPHPEIKSRNFVLKHLIEIDPDLADPVSGIQYTEIYKNNLS